ncbi:MAG TPA: AAA family ATPase [Actinomycetota bacterium]|nr:AAA family ATPase [Actinomycetota bacterium]
MTVEPSVIEEVRLTSFKSFSGAVLPLKDLTLIVGRNGSGKSNALDALWVLARLAQGEDIREALDGGREGPAVRGGAAGCAPFGQSFFELGCTVRTGPTVRKLDVRIQTEPTVQVTWERLGFDSNDLLITDPPRPDSGDINARWASKSLPPPAPVTFRATRLLASQVLARVPATPAGQKIHLAAAQVLAALRSVFVLDPVPDRMRQYIPRRDVLLRRSAENLSAAVASLLRDPDARERLRRALADLNEQEVLDVTVTESDLDDLMLTLTERFKGHSTPVPARIMSDGTLRFLAILTALMQAPTIDTTPEPLASEDASGQTMVVIEELENGLHASQAAMLIGLIRDEVKRRRVRALATAHSPALLDALSGEEHGSVVVCQRGSDGASILTPLVDLPNYLDIVAGGGLGRAAEHDRLRAREPTQDPVDVLDRILRGQP